MSLESRIDVIEARIHADSVSVPPNSLPLPRRPTNRDRMGLALALPQQQMPRNDQENKFRDIMKSSGIISINGVDYRTEMKDLEDLGELGDGTSGHVVKMRHIPSGEVIAVKQMRRTGNAEENKRIVNDIETALKAQSCPYIVQCLGFIITSADVWICMELMATCFDKLLKRSARPVPENILGKVTVAVVKALAYLKDKDTMHRDVKPSNILVDERGVIKLCDFGISGQLNNSKAKTRSAGCVAYLAPERIDPKISEYDVRADVWSLGITLVELATGRFPYQGCATDFEVLTCVMQSLPPALPADQGFSLDFQNFVKRCLIHDVNSRPKYVELLQLPFLVYYESKPVNVADWLVGAMKLADLPLHQRDIILRKPIEGKGTGGGGGTAAAAAASVAHTNGTPVHGIHIVDTSTTTIAATKPSTTSTCNVYAPHPHNLTKFTERTMFLEQPTTTALQIIPPSSRIAVANSPNLNHHHHHPHHHHPHHASPQPPPHLAFVELPTKGPVELNRVYRKSPFLPRKKELSEGKSAIPKKESKLTSIGNSLLKNLTTSPFAQRKSAATQAQQTIETVGQGIPSDDRFEHFHGHFESNGSPIPPVRHHFYNSPLLQRRNPSYVTYNEHHQMSPGRGAGGGRGSANTSPIVLQRFYHQQNQLREKGGGDDSQHGGIPDYLECGGGGVESSGSGSTNPFLSYSSSSTQSAKYQTRFIPKKCDMQTNNSNYSSQGYGVGGGEARPKWMTEPGGGSSGGRIPMAMIPTTATGHYQEELGGRSSQIPVAAYAETDPRKFVVNPLDNGRHYAPHFGADRMVANGGGGAGKGSEEKTLGWLNSIAGDVKRRFASYLKVNVNAHRENTHQEQAAESSHTQTMRSYKEEEQQGNGENVHRNRAAAATSSFAPTNPFLSAEDAVLETSSSGDHRLRKLPCDKATIERRHRSPDPPPRYNRGQSSPLLLRKQLEMSNNWGGSPFLSRRLMSVSPPGPTIRDCESVPGSPQHFRTKIHYTPEPQRRFYRHVE